MPPARKFAIVIQILLYTEVNKFILGQPHIWETAIKIKR